MATLFSTQFSQYSLWVLKHPWNVTVVRYYRSSIGKRWRWFCIRLIDLRLILNQYYLWNLLTSFLQKTWNIRGYLIYYKLSCKSGVALEINKVFYILIRSLMHYKVNLWLNEKSYYFVGNYIVLWVVSWMEVLESSSWWLLNEKNFL